ncbi:MULTISPECIES: histidine phosphatase family protein [Anaerolinea]|uniref:SixA phosphatase family protein n=1 Tax=Anaerolinea TaxID=233189 RepID=UPI0026341717|nr:histidine phosphatase family protein [Anaerolinea thermophila]
MKTLLIMRHGKSSWKDPALPDRERPLAKKGIKASRRMGLFIQEKELIPQRILCSSARRSVQTAQLFCETCGCPDTVEVLDELYMAEAETYIRALQNLPDELERVMIIGHNPGLEFLLQMLSGELVSLPTSVIAHLTLPIQHWSELNEHTEGSLIEVWKPKELPEDIIEQEKELRKETKVADQEEKKEKEKKKDKKKKEKKE